MKITLKIVLLCFILFSCEKTTKTTDKTTNKKEVLTEEKENPASTKEEINENSNYDIKIKFPDLTISMSDYDLSWGDDSPNDRIYETKQDTVFFTLNAGFDIEKPFKIEETGFDEIELYGQFEIKIGIETKQDIEDPLCVLDDWKGYTSKWSKLKIDRTALKLVRIEEKENYPIHFTAEELKLAVEKHCGPEWSNEIKNIESVDKIPFTFFVTKYVYKIKAKNSKTNKVIERYLVFYYPRSC
ncbi:hypothetical protein [uncultured Flavobacterium sp.]|uniref:hypothetical protein n=1 Tax=uncultured Flavobacterium sp. TaxID=165435 RepID=UPI003081F979